MGKRATSGTTSEGAAAYNKRQKTYHDVPTSEDVYDSDQLRRLLAFDQDMRNARHGMLHSLAATTECPDLLTPSRSSVLQEAPRRGQFQ